MPCANPSHCMVCSLLGMNSNKTHQNDPHDIQKKCTLKAPVSKRISKTSILTRTHGTYLSAISWKSFSFSKITWAAFSLSSAAITSRSSCQLGKVCNSVAWRGQNDLCQYQFSRWCSWWKIAKALQANLAKKFHLHGQKKLVVAFNSAMPWSDALVCHVHFFGLVPPKRAPSKEHR